jgi:glycosyltransferase involved in cell wall biosynthesis
VAALRILHLMSCRGWSSDAYGAGRLARELSDRGHRVTFVARAGTEATVLGRLRDLGVADLRTLPFGGRRAPAVVGRDVAAIRRWLDEHDVVHVHRGKEHWLAAIASRLGGRRVPLVRSRHIVAPVRRHALNRWLYRRATSHVVAVSEAIRRQYLASRLMSPERVTTLAGGVDAQRFHPGADGGSFRAAHGVDPGAVVIGVLGGLRRMKGQDVLLRATAALRRGRPRVHVLLVGGGRQAEALRALIDDLGLRPAVTMTGAVDDPERAVAAFDVAVYPSRWSEGMGRVVFEYMAAGRPIVASRVGLAAEVLDDGETARLVAPGDAEALARAIGAFVDDPARARAAGRACRDLVVRRHGGAVVAEHLEALYLREMAVAGAPAGAGRRA